jgi:putative spermidine/putrescine transport system substrate-binding protein
LKKPNIQKANLTVLFQISLVILSSFLFLVCSEKSNHSPLVKVGDGEGSLRIIAWQGYMERGEKDPNFDWISDFEKRTGCHIAVHYATTSDEMVSLMNEGGYDLVTASGDASLRLIQGNLVQEINIGLIPNWDQIDSRLKEAAWHTVNGKHYGVPYQWGANVLLYRTDIFNTAPKSWEVVFEELILPDGLSNKNRIQAFDGPIYIADAALYLMHRDKFLNIKNPYELNAEQFSAVSSLLKKQKKLVSKYWHDSSVQVQDFLTGRIVASSSWPYQVNQLLAKSAPVASTIPKEGVTGWADSTMMHIHSKHPNCAYLWMNHSLTTRAQGDIAAWYGSVPSVSAACENNERLGKDGCAKNGYHNFDKVWFWRTPTENCQAELKCVPYYEWVKEMISVMNQ